MNPPVEDIPRLIEEARAKAADWHSATDPRNVISNLLTRLADALTRHGEGEARIYDQAKVDGILRAAFPAHTLDERMAILQAALTPPASSSGEGE